MIIEFSLFNDTLFRYNALCLDDTFMHPEYIAKITWTSWIPGEGSVPCIGQLRLVLATRYLVILARGYEDRITTSSRITRHPVALETSWYNKIARCGWSLKNASTLASLFAFAPWLTCSLMLFQEVKYKLSKEVNNNHIYNFNCILILTCINMFLKMIN